MKALRIDGAEFRDHSGRTVLLRGINVAGSSKVPYRPDGATHRKESLADPRHVSFIGRPFPLEEANEHFRRLRGWGFNFLRLLITWEAIEHTGPGCYDVEYLDYLEAVVRKAGEHGLLVLIDPHQDVWSRFCGGDGAPGWTLEAAGFELANLHATGAAFLHAVHGDPPPHLIWPTNSTKLAAATMFTLFFAGDLFAPRTRIDGESAQDFLQRHYVDAMLQVARRLRGLAHVLGYDTMNEPWRGYIGWQDLKKPFATPFLGEVPSPFQSMLLGSGIAQDVGVYTMSLLGPICLRRRRVNRESIRAWMPGRECVWRENGVWDIEDSGQPILLRPRHFAPRSARPLDFTDDFYRPFARRFAAGIRQADPEAMIFLEAEPLTPPPRWTARDGSDVVFAPHWYDGLVMFLKDYRSWIAVDGFSNRLLLGRRRIRRAFADRIRSFQELARERMGPAPVVVGEFGIPFDLRGGEAFRTGNFSLQAQALDRSFCAMEDSLAHCALWNYTPDNDNAHGDQWNGEDFSIFSRSQQQDPGDLDSGGRALEAVVRPYPQTVSGRILRMSYDRERRIFQLEFRHDPAVDAPSEVFLPRPTYLPPSRVEVSDGAFEVDVGTQVLRYRHSAQEPVHIITLVGQEC